jgi:hypothetical protein
MTLGRMLGELRAGGEFLAGIPRFVRHSDSLPESTRILREQLATRTESFARVFRHGIFAHRASPYRRLLDWARIDLDNVLALLRTVGTEGTLERLFDAGVHVTLEEFKGLRPILRPGLEFSVRAEDFDNPLSARQYETRTGGSSGSARRILVGLDLLAHESAYHAGFYHAARIEKRRAAMWLPAPPGAVGIKNALIRARLGRPIERWFSQTRMEDAPFRHRAFARSAAWTTALSGARLPLPEFTPPGEAGAVVEWLAARRSTGTPGILLSTPSAAVRTCAAAVERGFDISGTLFVLVGEPYTAAKASALARAGCGAFAHYAMVECGMIGLACLEGVVPDDVHLVSEKIATIQRELPVWRNGQTAQVLLHTTLRPASPKVMLNVESGDCGIVERRECGCGALPAGFDVHLHTIRSYEKLTSEGMHFLGGELLQLVEQVLPARFGGHPTDYQLVEREDDALPKVELVVSPSVGDVDPAEVVDAALAFLRSQGPGQRLMADVWAGSATLCVVRREPHVTAAGKIQPLRKRSA